MTYCYATGVQENRPNIQAMPLIDELFLFLVRIRLGLFQQDLDHRFNIHILSVSRKITTWANYLYFFGVHSLFGLPGLMFLPRCLGKLRNYTELHVLFLTAQKCSLRHHHLLFYSVLCTLPTRVIPPSRV